MPEKSEALPALQIWLQRIESQTGDRVKAILSDRGELDSDAYRAWADEHGIDYQWTSPEGSAQNGIVERMHRTLNGRTRAMCLALDAPPSFWDKCATTAAYLHNLTPLERFAWKTPYELFNGCTPDVSHLREIGCQAYALTLGHNPKVYARSKPCKLIGYAPHSKVWRLWCKDVNGHSRIFESVHVEFIESHNAGSRIRPRGGFVPPVAGPTQDPFAADGYVGSHRPTQPPKSRVGDLFDEEELERLAAGVMAQEEQVEQARLQERHAAEEERGIQELPPQDFDLPPQDVDLPPQGVPPPVAPPPPAPRATRTRKVYPPALPREHRAPVQSADERLRIAIEEAAKSAEVVAAQRAEHSAAKLAENADANEP